MLSKSRFVVLVVLAVVVLSPILAACGATPTPTAVPPTAVPTKAAATAVPPTSAPPTAVPPTKAPPTATPVPPTPTPKGPTVGGTLVMAEIREPDTFDAHKSTTASLLKLLGSSLIALSPDGLYVPYLAQSWKVSDDGKTYDFLLKKGVKFTDGTPCTAKDFVWTYQRAMDRATKATVAGTTLSAAASVEAPDDYTLRIVLKTAFYPFIYGLSQAGYLQPLSQAAVEKGGDNYGRSPLGVGPYKLKEWKTGAEVILERNPDFNWGPPFQHQGPYYIQTLDYKVIPEYSTRLAGLESGEIGWALLEPKDVARIRALNKFQISESVRFGMWPLALFNFKVPALTDINVRKAFNMAIDRQVIVNGAEAGNAVVQYQPLAPTTIGYSAALEQYGNKYDPAQAKTLLAASGYKPNASGIMEKDGKPLAFKLSVVNMVASWTKVAEIMKEQCKAVGIDLTIQIGDIGAVIGDAVAGKLEVTLMGTDYGDADIMQYFFGTGGAAIILTNLNDPALDKLFSDTRTIVDPAKRQEAVNQAQMYIMQNALSVPLYSSKDFYAMTNQVKGAIYSAKTGQLYLGDAYVETK